MLENLPVSWPPFFPVLLLCMFAHRGRNNRQFWKLPQAHIKKSWINLSLFKISNRAIIKNSPGLLCLPLVNTSLVLLRMMSTASARVCAWSLTLLSRAKAVDSVHIRSSPEVFTVSEAASVPNTFLSTFTEVWVLIFILTRVLRPYGCSRLPQASFYHWKSPSAQILMGTTRC